MKRGPALINQRSDMSELSHIQLLADDMAALYRLIYQDDSWPEHVSSRAEPHIHYKHIVRYLVRRERVASFTAVAAAEGHLLGDGFRDHTTIMNSVWRVQEELKATYKDLIANLNVFYDGVRSSGEGLDYFGQLARYHGLPEHVKSLLLAGMCNYKLVHPGLLDTMCAEYEQVDADFFDRMLQQKSKLTEEL